MSHGSDSVKSIFFALGANLAIAVAKFAAAIVTGSGSMMAEAVHSAADSGNQLLLLLGLKQAKKPPSADYPLGHGKGGLLLVIYCGPHPFQHGRPVFNL